jgi:hypothetical protein
LISWIGEENKNGDRWGGIRRKRRDREREEKRIIKCTLHTVQYIRSANKIDFTIHYIAPCT